MVSRTRKLLGATLVLLIGFGLAWPFHRSNDKPSEVPPTETPAAEVEPPPPVPQRLTGPIDLTDLPYGAESTIAAAPIATMSPAETAGSPSVDAQRFTPHPAPMTPAYPRRRPEAQVHEADAPFERPTNLAPLRPLVPESPAPEARVHVVHNGDTLGRLAQRYLGNEDRALEIFDLNREVLDNPHLLPIGAQLKLPPK